MLQATRDMVMPTAATASYPRPLWCDQNINSRLSKAGEVARKMLTFD